MSLLSHYKRRVVNFVKNRRRQRQMIDIAAFTLGAFLIYRFGKTLGDAIDNELPTEKKMLELINQQSMGPGGGMM